MFRQFGFIIALLSSAALARGQDSFDASLGFSASAGSLPPWTKPSQQDRQQLGNYVRNARQGVLLVGHPKFGRGTAWVLSRKHRLLATNAHVADIQHEAGGTMFGIVNGGATLYTVERAWYHPGVRRYVAGGPATMKASDPAVGPVYPHCPDLAVLQLSEQGEDLPVELTMAEPQAFEQLFAQSSGILGFPGHDTTSWPALGETAEASFHDGVISRLTDFHNSVNVPLARRQFLQYTMSTWGGFSGSPILLPSGEVVAVHNSASYKQGSGGDVKAIPHGVRIDCLWELLAYHGLDDRVPLPVDKSALDIDYWLNDDPADIALRQAMALAQEASDLIYNQEKFSEGVKKCTEALKLAPDYAQAYSFRVDGYLNYWFKYRRQIDRDAAFKQLQYAEQDAKKYAGLNPTDPWAALNLVLVYNNAGSFLDNDDLNAEALKIVNKLLESDNLPVAVRASAYSNRAIAYDNLDQDDQALRDHNEAIRLAPNNPQWYENRADFWHYQGRSDLEEQDYATARQIRQGRR